MIDHNGYRLNVGIILANQYGQLFWGKRIKSHSWQFPQGGVQPYETLKETMYRELTEETGLTKHDVTILAITKRWLHYKLPLRLQHRNYSPCVGQKQKWFLLLLTSNDNKIDLKTTAKPEFNAWRWVKYWEPLKHVIYFKRNVYLKVLTTFEPTIKAKIQEVEREQQEAVDC